MQVPDQHITAVAMIPDIDASKVTVTVNASSSAGNLTAEVEIHFGGKRVSCTSSKSIVLRHICRDHAIAAA